MTEPAEEQAVDDDLRIVYMHSLLTKSVKFKADKWHKMMGVDEYNEVIMDFLNGVTHKILLIHLTNAGTLIPAVSFPLPAKTKVTYFIRGFDDVITAENFHSVVIFGDISPRPVESLAVLFEQRISFLHSPESYF
nr:PREDICTED: dynein heavy chain 17, axonemal-like [Bemisia tabaci]